MAVDSLGLPQVNSLMMIVFNPVVGRQRAHLLWRVLDVLVTHGVRLDLAETQWPGHATDLARGCTPRRNFGGGGRWRWDYCRNCQRIGRHQYPTRDHTA